MLNLTVLSLSELKFTSPDSLVTREGEELTVPKKTLKILMNSLGLVGDKFSKDLFDIDEVVWSELVQKKCASSPFYTDNSAIIANGEIINVVSNNNREWLEKVEAIIKSYSKEEGLEIKTLREEDGFCVLCMKGELGFVLSVNIPDKHITSHNVYLSPENILCVSPSCTVNCKIDSGVNTSDLLTLLDCASLLGTDSAENYEHYLEYTAKTKMSYADVLDALKVIFGVKIKSDIPTPEEYIKGLEGEGMYSLPELEFGTCLIREVYKHGYHYIPKANKLEKHLKFIDVFYKDFIAALSSRFLSGNLEFAFLDNYSLTAFGELLDYTVVSRIFDL